jgi:hypothetical protein
MSDIDRFAMPPRQVESPFVKKVDNHSRVDSVEMPPRSGGFLPSNRTSQYNSGNKFQQNGTGRQFNNNKSNSAMDIRNIPHMSVLHQSYGSYNTYPPRQQHAGGPIRHERQQVPRGTPYNIPPPHQYPILHQAQSFNYQQQRPGVPITTINTSRNLGRSNVVTNGRNLQTNDEKQIKISFSNDSLNTIEPSSEIQDRLDSLERTQQLLLKELDANKKGLKNKAAEIESLTHTIEDQKQKLNKKEQATRSNNSQQNEDQYDYRITSSRNSYDEDDDAFDTNTQPITTGSINAMFARARNASYNKTL